MAEPVGAGTTGHKRLRTAPPISAPVVSLDGDDNARLLKQHGYAISLRADGWVECLLSRDAERWLGRGATARAALEDALGRMLPSALARDLLRAARGRAAMPRADAPTVVMPAAAPKAAEPGRRGPSEPPAERKTVVRRSASSDRTPQPPPPPPQRRPRPAMSVHDGLDQLQDLQESIDADLIELGQSAPAVQRLQMVAWISRARWVEESCEGEVLVERGARDIAQQLARLAKIWWPGTVKALFADSEPSEVRFDLPGKPRCDTWLQVAEAAEKALEKGEAQVRGSDEYGWADGRALRPAPRDIQATFQEARATIERFGGPLRSPPRGPGEVRSRMGGDPDTVAAIERAAAMVRWVRSHYPDAETWALAIGRLRWLASALRKVGNGLARVLDPSHSPKGGWAAALGQDPHEKARRKARAELLRQFSELGDHPLPEALVQWLEAAFVVLGNGRIAELAVRHRETILDLCEEQLEESNRRTRRRLGSLQRILRGELPVDAEEGEEGDEEPEDELPEPAPVEDPFIELGRRLRPRLVGQTALLVSNRADPELVDRLAEGTGLVITQVVAGPQRIRSQAEAVAGGRYDYVLGATGFMSHSTEAALVRACRQAKCRYVRVFKGRPLAVARALARALGLVGHGAG